MSAAEVKARASHQQTMEALAYANRVRHAQVSLKREVESGETTVVDALADPRIATATTVADVIAWQPRWGRKRTRAFLDGVAIQEARPARAITERQRALIAETLTGVGSSV